MIENCCYIWIPLIDFCGTKLVGSESADRAIFSISSITSVASLIRRAILNIEYSTRSIIKLDVKMFDMSHIVIHLNQFLNRTK